VVKDWGVEVEHEECGGRGTVGWSAVGNLRVVEDVAQVEGGGSGAGKVAVGGSGRDRAIGGVRGAIVGGLPEGESKSDSRE
jgi:hypothetical protein